MKKKNKRSSGNVSIYKGVRSMYATLDAAMAKRLQSHEAQVSCKRGCYGCCHLFVTTTTIEALLIAQTIMQRANWREFLPIVRQHALNYDYPGVGQKDYFTKAIRCLFLSEQNDCSIYEVRPSECRYHYVVSPPENCYPGAEDTTVLGIDANELKSCANHYEDDVMKSVNGEPFAGPLPIILVKAFRMIVEDVPGPAADAVNAAFEGIITPEKWMIKYVESFLAQADLTPDVVNIEDVRDIILSRKKVHDESDAKT